MSRLDEDIHTTTVRLTRAELIVAWQRARLPELPIVLTYPPLPATASVLAAAEQRLRDRGLVDHRGVRDDLLHAALHVAVRGKVQIGIRMVRNTQDQPRHLRVCAAGRPDFSAVFAVVDGDEVTVTEVPSDELVRRALAALPVAVPAPGGPLTLPTDVLRAAVARAAADTREDFATVPPAMRAHGFSSSDITSMTNLVGGVRRAFATLDIAVRDGRDRLAQLPQSINLVDSAGHGENAPPVRAALYQRGRDTVIAPATPERLDEVITGWVRARL